MARREELYILRLIGATESFIRTPFILEGLMQGLSGGVAALCLLFILFTLLISRFQLPLGLSLIDISFLPASMAWFLVLAA